MFKSSYRECLLLMGPSQSSTENFIHSMHDPQVSFEILAL